MDEHKECLWRAVASAARARKLAPVLQAKRQTRRDLCDLHRGPVDRRGRAMLVQTSFNCKRACPMP
eukprot:CAMPEP_0171503026 /NCGR_PEP_ID=MMETSP0958-20121227/10595_1 /TAXON_ID=87120 /ORGANISM="Aurantiochytrium limacinum, Strain ATCCMYA-1381" /LENGTH=65 /DNA_ID=CAMNT_0012038327 /DNA_START=801 /DNA_END=998 /DNA_ORIENTATION=+